MDSIQHKPELWLLIIIVGLPILSETVYTPALPDIAHVLKASHAMVEYTLTIYLFGFAIGTLLWGKLSDVYGRKIGLLYGMAIYVLSCLGCYSAITITQLMIYRFLQAFGASAGSVLGQAICRDAFEGPERGRAFSIIGGTLALAPAFGPVVGGMIDQTFGWNYIFIALALAGSWVLATIQMRLSETGTRAPFSWLKVTNTFSSMMRDPKVLAYGLLVAACNGISFSYLAEGSFYLIEMLGLSPALYGFSFIGIAVSGFAGGFISTKLHERQYSESRILSLGNSVIFGGALVFTLGTFVLYGIPGAALYSLMLTLVCMSIMMIGIRMMIPSLLSSALNDYKYAIGTASSLFGFYYYCMISLFTFIMGMLHNDTLFPMPIYFLAISIGIWITRRLFIK